mgnify:CR=1 FL=1
MLLINKLLIVIILLLVIILVAQMYMLSNNRLLKWEMFYTKPIRTKDGDIKYDPNPEHDTVYHKRMDDVISKQELAKIGIPTQTVELTSVASADQPIAKISPSSKSKREEPFFGSAIF